MRKTLTAIAVAVAALATAGAALAVYTQHASVAFTGHQAGKSTGLTSNIYSTATTGDQLKSAKAVVMTFPAKTRFNLGTSLVKRCKYTDAQLTSTTAPKTCPKSSRIGKGSGSVNVGAQEGAQLPLTVRAYVRNSSTMLLVVDAAGTLEVIHAVVHHQKLTIGVPQGSMGGIPIILTGLKLSVPKKGTGSQALIKSGRCTAEQFKISTQLKYSDGTSTTIASTSHCS